MILIECTLGSLDLISTFPKLNFMIGSDSYTVEPLDLFSSCVIKDDSDDKEDYLCNLHLISTKDQPVFGIPFFNSNFMVFDKEGRRIGRLVFYYRHQKKRAQVPEVSRRIIKFLQFFG